MGPWSAIIVALSHGRASVPQPSNHLKIVRAGILGWGILAAVPTPVIALVDRLTLAAASLPAPPVRSRW